MTGRKRICIISGAVAAAAAAAAACIFTYGETRPSADQINNASLIIGTYLIDFEALNEENQALAEKNAEDKNQNRIYYKSDLNSGVWYDITDAESVSDITLSNNKIVDAKTINALELTLYFKADGTIVDLVNGGTVSASMIDSAVYPANIDACKSLVEQLNITNELVNSTADYGKDEELEAKHSSYRAEQDALNAVLAPVSDSYTYDMTAKLRALEANTSDAAAALRVKLRAQLDKHCAETVYDRIDVQTEILGNPDKNSHADIISALTDAQSSLLEDISTLDSETSSGSGAAAEKQAELEDELIAAATNGNTSAAEKAAEKLAVLDALTNGKPTDAAAAAEMAEELFADASDTIDSLISSVENGTNDVYSDDSTVTSADVKTALTAAIKEAEGYAKDSAYYTAGDTNSAEYNSIVSEKLGGLGDRLEALSAGTGGDSLLNGLRKIASDCSADILAQAADAEALSDSSLADERARLGAAKEAIDKKYDEYIDAVSSGNNSLADSKKAELDELTEALAKMQNAFAAEIGGKYSALLDAIKDGDLAAQRKSSAEKDALKTLLSDADAALLDSFDDAMDSFIEAAESGSSAGYSDLTDALKNVPENCMDNDTRAKVLTTAADILRKNGADDISAQISSDIAAAGNGGMTPSADSADGTGGSGNIPAADELYSYSLVIPQYDIYSSALSLPLDGTAYINARDIAQLIGAQYIPANGVFVIKGNNILIEFTVGSNTAYVGDKLLMTDAAPRRIGTAEYIPSQLLAAGLGLSEQTENGTLFIR